MQHFTGIIFGPHFSAPGLFGECPTLACPKGPLTLFVVVGYIHLAVATKWYMKYRENFPYNPSSLSLKRFKQITVFWTLIIQVQK